MSNEIEGQQTHKAQGPVARDSAKKSTKENNQRDTHNIVIPAATAQFCELQNIRWIEHQ